MSKSSVFAACLGAGLMSAAATPASACTGGYLEAALTCSSLTDYYSFVDATWYPAALAEARDLFFSAAVATGNTTGTFFIQENWDGAGNVKLTGSVNNNGPVTGFAGRNYARYPDPNLSLPGYSSINQTLNLTVTWVDAIATFAGVLKTYTYDNATFRLDRTLAVSGTFAAAVPSPAAGAGLAGVLAAAGYMALRRRGRTPTL